MVFWFADSTYIYLYSLSLQVVVFSVAVDKLRLLFRISMYEIDQITCLLQMIWEPVVFANCEQVWWDIEIRIKD